MRTHTKSLIQLIFHAKDRRDSTFCWEHCFLVCAILVRAYPEQEKLQDMCFHLRGTIYHSRQCIPVLIATCVICESKKIDPYFSDDGIVTGDWYKKVFPYSLCSQLGSCRFDVRFQPYCDLPHCVLSMRHWAEQTIYNNWTERDRLILWPKPAAHLTAFGLFL